jgi:glycosyltransferase involved in cell wall biosynthesis
MVNAIEPLVSVITPTYNRSNYLKQALTSAIGQTYRNIEIIVCDNCSFEDPRSLVESFGDSRVVFSRNSQNLGMIANTLKAFKMARGKYVACLLDDDMWEADFLAKLVPHLEANSNLALAFSDHHVIRADGSFDVAAADEYSQIYKRSELKEGIYQPFDKLGLVDKAIPTAMTAVIRRDVIDWENFPAEVEGSWDMYITYLCCRSGLGAYYYPERLTRYREHENTETMQSGSRNYQTKIRKAQGDLFCYEKFLADETLQHLHPYFKERWAHINTTLGIGLIRAQKLPEARHYLWRSLQQQFSLRSLVGFVLSFTNSSLASRF